MCAVRFQLTASEWAKSAGFVAALCAPWIVCGAAIAGPIPALDFRFTDVVGTTVPNHGTLGSAGDATLASGTTVVAGPTPVVRLGYENASLLIDSSSDRMFTPDIDSLDTLGSFTLSFFVKPTGNYGTWREMIGDSDGTSSPYTGWYLQARDMNGATSPRNRALFLVGPGYGTGSVQFYTPDDFIVPDTWQHLAVVVTGLQDPGSHVIKVDFYRNGELFSAQSATTSLTMGNSVFGLRIGDTHWDASLFAQYAGVNVFASALTADEMRAHYNFMITVPEPGGLALLGTGTAGLVLLGALRRRRERLGTAGAAPLGSRRPFARTAGYAIQEGARLPGPARRRGPRKGHCHASR